jgi:hypothetical protein
MEETRLTVGVMQALAQPDKVNVGALGNVVARLSFRSSTLDRARSPSAMVSAESRGSRAKSVIGVDLSPQDAARLMEETRLTVGVMQALAQPDKVNVGALGNDAAANNPRARSTSCAAACAG